jgi:hypothetical protein
MIIEYTDCHVHRIRLDFADLKDLPELVPASSIPSKLLDAALLVIGDVRSHTKTYEVLTYQNGKVWLNGYDK